MEAQYIVFILLRLNVPEFDSTVKFCFKVFFTVTTMMPNVIKLAFDSTKVLTFVLHILQLFPIGYLSWCY